MLANLADTMLDAVSPTSSSNPIAKMSGGEWNSSGCVSTCM